MPSPYSSSTRVYYRSEEHHHCNKRTEIDEQQIISSTDALLLQKVREEGYDWQQDHWTGDREHMESTRRWKRPLSNYSIGGPGIDEEISCFSAEKMDGKKWSSRRRGAKDGKQELSLGRRKCRLEVDSRRRIMIGDHQHERAEHQVHCDVISGPIPAAQGGRGGHHGGRVLHPHRPWSRELRDDPERVYTHSEIAWGQGDGAGTQDGLLEYKSAGQVKFLVEMETDRDRILDAHIIGPNAGEMITEGALALECDASAREHRKHDKRTPNNVRGVPRGSPASVFWQCDPLLE
ncbi:hypothetical protein H4582DRAFT_2152313 [Lactarius indigo]|nr:hypothetical protein H4582DRAFT_2152313 [Lactarius indigo]